MVASIWLFHSYASAAQDGRYLRQDIQGRPVSAQDSNDSQLWSCAIDRKTGLTWEVKTNDDGPHSSRHLFQYLWTTSRGTDMQASSVWPRRCALKICTADELISHANQEQYCGRNDWRLPRREELRSLVTYTTPYPGPTIDRETFPNTLAQFYWAQEKAADDSGYAWGIGFALGFDYSYPTETWAPVRLVAGGNASTKPGCETLQGHLLVTETEVDDIVDVRTHLRWRRCSSGQHWQNADCRGDALLFSRDNLPSPPGSGWRLPTLLELASLADLTCTLPAINHVGFPNTPSSDFWTGTVSSNDDHSYWVMNFYYGDNRLAPEASRAHVRWVKSENIEAATSR